ncbi:exo-beta-N-acetylmuramidase NamZ domain-containing protein [Polaribacter sp. Asnod1-A03]|uniref:exo-beta-N-acetylmuramidase NamZ family protein n=1 Tax=Polaribacter sp. Asnod1-A03 TaxID=3160581 RepID=UPI00386F4CDB
MKKSIILLLAIASICCSSKSDKEQKEEKSNLLENKVESKIIVAANRTEKYLPMLKGKSVGVVANQTSVIFKEEKNTHLVDSLLALNINVTKVFAPEHGFRGKADAGEHIEDGIDKTTGLPIISLYGSNRKPSHEHLKGIEVMLFDIQDVGVRFYTYISTLHYVMEVCAELNIPLIVLDRPNPNGHYIDGPILEEEVKSFVGMHPVPTVYGMTIGEYGKMINGEKWLENGVKCNLTVIPLENYTHQSEYDLSIIPSPNLPNTKSINLYPSLCFFEGTNVSAGRGTEMQFQIFGSPFLSKDFFKFSFIPKPNFGSKHPKHDGELCYGTDLRNNEKLSSLNLKWLIESYHQTENKAKFFNSFFSKLAGTKKLQKQIEEGMSTKEIKEIWQGGLDSFKKVRNKYIIY